jgi:spore coat protein U-like protein
MTRRIIAIAASALALGTFGFAPLAVQAASESATGAQTIAVTAEAVDAFTVSNPGTIAFGSFDPGAGANAAYTFNVSNDGLGYTVAFSSFNQPTVGGSFELLSSVDHTTKIPYTIAPATTGDTSTYLSGSAGQNLTALTPSFSLAIAPVSETLPLAGAYTDTLTLTVTPV